MISERSTLPTGLVMAWLISVGPAAPGVTAADTALPEEVHQALVESAEGMQHVTVAWREEFSSPLPLKALLKRCGLPEGMETFLLPREYRYIRQGEHFYYYSKQRRQVPPEPPYVDWHEWAYDGGMLYEHTRAAADDSDDAEQYTPLLTVYKIADITTDEKTKNTPFVLAAYFRAVGFEVPQFGGDLDRRPQSLILHLLDTGAQLVSVGDGLFKEIPSLRVELRDAARIYVFHLDPQLHYAVRGYHEKIESGASLLVVENEDFVELPETTVRLPRRSHMEWHSWKDWYNWNPVVDEITQDPLVLVDLAVTELHRDRAPEEQFAFDVREAESGTLVGDGRLPGADGAPHGRVSYIVPADKAALDAAIAEAVRGQQERARFEAQRPWKRLFLILTGALVLGTFLTLLWRRARYAQ